LNQENLIKSGAHFGHPVSKWNPQFKKFILSIRNGVHIINRKTGKPIRNFANESFGDLDVNGTLIHNNLIYFGNDNDEFICADFKGKIKYSLPVSGDVESQAVLIKNRGADVLVFGTEAGELRAINPKTGKTIWQHFHKDFDGWKMGDNRLVFKVKTHFKSTFLFFEKPIVRDLNSDGVKDLIYTINGQFYSVNGKNGKLLAQFDIQEDFEKWDQPGLLFVSSNQESLIFSKDNKGKQLVTVLKYSHRPIPDSYRTDGYGLHMVVYDMDGNIVESKLIDKKVKSRNFIRVPNTRIICTGDVVFHFDKNWEIERKIELHKIKKIQDDYFSFYLSDQLIKYEKHQCIVMLFQYKNLVAFYDVDTGSVVRTFELKKRSEFIPQVLDANKDGNMDLLIADDSNMLRCIDLGPNVKLLNK
jgi:hypothetical protein